MASGAGSILRVPGGHRRSREVERSLFATLTDQFGSTAVCHAIVSVRPKSGHLTASPIAVRQLGREIVLRPLGGKMLGIMVSMSGQRKIEPTLRTNWWTLACLYTRSELSVIDL